MINDGRVRVHLTKKEQIHLNPNPEPCPNAYAAMPHRGGKQTSLFLGKTSSFFVVYLLYHFQKLCEKITKVMYGPKAELELFLAFFTEILPGKFKNDACVLPASTQCLRQPNCPDSHYCRVSSLL